MTVVSAPVEIVVFGEVDLVADFVVVEVGKVIVISRTVVKFNCTPKNATKLNKFL